MRTAVSGRAFRRIPRAFLRVRAVAAAVEPALARVRWTVCHIADRDHRKKWRQFAHANHFPDVVCIAAAAETELRDGELLGLVAHEIGHVEQEAAGAPAHRRDYAGPGTPKSVQDEANVVAREISRRMGMGFRYGSRTVQEMYARPNPGRRIAPNAEWEEIEEARRGGRGGPFARKILALETRYARLAKSIDRKYATGRTAGVEGLEEEAETIHERLVGLYEHLEEDEPAKDVEPDPGEYVSIEEALAVAYGNRRNFESDDSWISHLRGIVRYGTGIHMWPMVPRQDVTDRQLVEAARDAYERRKALRERYLAGRAR